MNNRDALHLNIRGRKQLCERLANLILPGRPVAKRPTLTRHASGPLIQQTPTSAWARPRPFIAQQRPRQPSHRPERHQHTCPPVPSYHQTNKTKTKPYQQKNASPAPSRKHKDIPPSVRTDRLSSLFQ